MLYCVLCVTAGELDYDPAALMQRCVTSEFNTVANVFITVSDMRLSMLLYTSNFTNYMTSGSCCSTVWIAFRTKQLSATNTADCDMLRPDACAMYTDGCINDVRDLP